MNFNTNKKSLIWMFLLFVALMVIVAGCGGAAAPAPAQPAQEEAQPAEEAAQPAEEEAAAPAADGEKIELRFAWWGSQDRHDRTIKVIEMYEAESGDQVGRYVSSERSLFVYCWAEDSTGVFARDHTLGTGSIFIIFNRPSTDRPVIKLLVSE